MVGNEPQSAGNSEPALQQCVTCHSGGGISSLNSPAHLLRPNGAQPDPNEAPPNRPKESASQWWASDSSETTNWKNDRYDWGLLNGYWKSSAGSH
jgi:hypothetical protein